MSVTPLVSSDDPFDLAQFVRNQESPLVVIMFGNATHKPCLDMVPLFEALAKQGAPIVSCFNVDVEVSQGVAVAAEISKLPTCIFYTTKLSNDNLMVVDQVVGANKTELRDKFVKGHQVVAGYLQSLNAQNMSTQPITSTPVQASPQVPPPVQASTPLTQSVAASNTSQQVTRPPTSPSLNNQMPAPPRPNDIVKKELVDIRNQLIATIRRIEHLYAALQ